MFLLKLSNEGRCRSRDDSLDQRCGTRYLIEFFSYLAVEYVLRPHRLAPALVWPGLASLETICPIQEPGSCLTLTRYIFHVFVISEITAMVYFEYRC